MKRSPKFHGVPEQQSQCTVARSGSPSDAASIRPDTPVIKACILRVHSLNKDYVSAICKQDPLFSTGAVAVEKDKSPYSHHRCYLHTGRAETIPRGWNSSCEHSSLERSTQARGPDRGTGQLGGRQRGGSQSSRQGQAVCGLENRIKSFRLHPKTKGQFSKDLS